ncbi:hypothetical protein HDU98_008618, partial [Podochytrium sp. JEL0797]
MVSSTSRSTVASQTPPAASQTPATPLVDCNHISTILNSFVPSGYGPADVINLHNQVRSYVYTQIGIPQSPIAWNWALANSSL